MTTVFESHQTLSGAKEQKTAIRIDSLTKTDEVLLLNCTLEKNGERCGLPIESDVHVQFDASSSR